MKQMLMLLNLELRVLNGKLLTDIYDVPVSISTSAYYTTLILHALLL